MIAGGWVWWTVVWLGGMPIAGVFRLCWLASWVLDRPCGVVGQGWVWFSGDLRRVGVRPMTVGFNLVSL